MVCRSKRVLLPGIIYFRVGRLAGLIRCLLRGPLPMKTLSHFDDATCKAHAKVYYSILSARIGSTEVARRAGMIAAIAAAAKRSATLPPMASGSITGVW